MSHATDFPACPGQSALTKITVDNRSFWLHPEVAPIFESFLKEIVRLGYNLDAGILDDWSYACRDIRGSTRVSEHARGTAIDINATTNPMGSVLRTDMPPFVAAAAKAHGLRWGGTYTSRPDAMHFEWLGTIAEARAKVAELKAKGAPTPTVDDKSIDPTDSPGAIKFLQVLLNLAGQKIPVDGVYGTQTGQAIKNLKRFFNEKNIGSHTFDLSPERGWKAGPAFLKTLADWLNFLKSRGVF